MRTTQFVAFLRAINIGSRIVKMSALKKAFETDGFEEVSTFIASGNVIFSASGGAAALEKRIEACLERALAYPVATMLRTTQEVAAVVERLPFSARALDGASLYVGFIKATPGQAAIRKVASLQTGVDELRVAGREVYWLARQHIAGATITGAAVEKALQTPVTFRNINTVRRLAAKYAAR